LPEKEEVRLKRFKVNKSDYQREVLIISLQHYLEFFWITLSEESAHFLVTLTRKNTSEKYPLEKEFINNLIEAEFLYNKINETRPLREQLLSAALKPYEDVTR